jgi:hypothetical protein
VSGYALNVRSQQLSSDGMLLRISRQNLYRAIRLIGRRLLLYRPRDEDDHGYFGTATIADVEIDPGSSTFIWLALTNTTLFSKPVPLSELYGTLHVNDNPFHTYSRALRPVTDYELQMLLGLEHVDGSPGLNEGHLRVELDEAAPNWSVSKSKTRRRLLRAQMLELYGPHCALSGHLHIGLNGRFYETQVGHVVALEYGGPDIIQNVIPMTGTANWHWDHGLISLTNEGRILVSSRASPDTRKLFKAGRQVHFPDPRFWPRAEYLQWHRDVVYEKGRRPGLEWSRQ